MIRVGNTDAEGRMVMVDVLCEAKEVAQNEVNPHLFTVATLTGHVIRAYGPDYTAILANGPAKDSRIPEAIRDSGDLMGDMYEISTLRREDYNFVAGPSEYEDLLQANNGPSTMTSRGHQFPMAFLIEGSGLDKHGNDSSKKLPYCHVDIAGSSGPFPGIPTGSPLPSFYQQFIVPSWGSLC
jgi:leucyl aminopeptidase